MPNIRLLLVLITAGHAALVSASALIPRAVINHDAVVSMPETIPSNGIEGAVALAYQPLLKVESGCVPFPAVDAEGNTGGGLQETGSQNGGCSKSTGQIYVRYTTVRDMYVLLYAWYFPKDTSFPHVGHRHDWESCAVWLKSSVLTTPENILAVCPSAHGGYNCAKAPHIGLQGSRPLIKYDSIPPLDHSLDVTEAVGGSQPLVEWFSMPLVARMTLSLTDFGSANMPLKYGNFESNLAKAAF